MSLASIAERLTAKSWTAAEIADIAGEVRRAAVTHAGDSAVREGAASGGSVTALLENALASGDVDAALVCVTRVEDGRVRARYRLATTAEEIRAAQGSTYVLGDLLGEGLPLIENHPGRVAVVGLPCEITGLAKRTHLAEKIALRVALFCGHASRTDLVDAVVERMAEQAGDEAKLVAFRFRSGHWRGRMRAEFDNGAVVEQPFSRFGMYQNLYVGCAKKCLFCNDHFGYNADVSAGDLWSARYKSDPIKHTALLVRSERGDSAVKRAAAEGALEVADVAVTEVLDGQRRVAPFHYNVTARAEAGVALGMKIPDRGQRVRWHERIAASMVLKTCRATETREGIDAELAKPRRLQQLKLLVLKGLESLS